MNQINLSGGVISDNGHLEPEEVKEEVLPTENETPAELPTESPVEADADTDEQKQVEEEPSELPSNSDTELVIPEEVLKKEVAKATEGLRGEIVDLRKKLALATGSDRKIIQDDIKRAEQEIEDLGDVDPNDVALIEKVLRSKGYVTRGEAEGMAYKSVQNEELNKFLESYPEYKPENDPNDVNWNTLQNALSLYAKPKDPKLWGTLLKKAHSDIAPRSLPTRDNTEVKKQQLKVAGVGSSGVQKSSSRKQFTPQQRQVYLDGGWSEEDIKDMESKL